LKLHHQKASECGCYQWAWPVEGAGRGGLVCDGAWHCGGCCVWCACVYLCVCGSWYWL